MRAVSAGNSPVLVFEVGGTTMQHTKRPTRSAVRRLLGASAAAVLAVGGLAAAAADASASDWGGYANPAVGCGSNYVVAAAPVYTSQLSNGMSLYIGELQVKWSYGCPGNYARFAAAGGINPNWIGISIHAQASPYNKAGADETNTRIAYTRVIALARSSDRVCAYLDVTLNVQGQPAHGAKVLCA